MGNLKLVLTVAFFCLYGIIRAQGCSGTPCSSLVPPPPVLVCDPGTQTLLTNNAAINSGQTFYYQGGTATFSGVNVNGGTLIICQGPVTFDGFGFGTGNVVIAAGATVNFTNYYNAGTGSHYFYNYGTVNFTIDISIQGNTTHVVYNGSGGVINSTGRMDIVNGGLIVNEGMINVSGEVRIQGNGQACLGNGSQVNTGNLWVDNTNPVSVPVGAACVGYSNQMLGNGSLTSSPCLILCQGSTASPPANPSSIGSATLITNCIDCGTAPLAVELISFDLLEMNDGVLVKWVTGPETTTLHFVLERGNTVDTYKEIVKIEALESIGTVSEPETHYSFYDSEPFPGVVNYYRLLEEDGNGIRKEVAVKNIKLKKTDELVIYPNPCLFGKDFQIHFQTKKKRNTRIEVQSASGVLIRQERLEENTLIHYMSLPKGCFMIYLFENESLLAIRRIIVI